MNLTRNANKYKTKNTKCKVCYLEDPNLENAFWCPVRSHRRTRFQDVMECTWTPSSKEGSQKLQKLLEWLLKAKGKHKHLCFLMISECFSFFNDFLMFFDDSSLIFLVTQKIRICKLFSGVLQDHIGRQVGRMHLAAFLMSLDPFEQLKHYRGSMEPLLGSYKKS